MPGRRYGFGECYFECNKDQAEELLDKQKEDTMKEIAVLNGELNSIHETLATLKTQLCARSYSEPPTHSRHDTTLSPCTLRPRRTSTLLAVHTSACACSQIWPLRQQHQPGGEPLERLSWSAQAIVR